MYETVPSKALHCAMSSAGQTRSQRRSSRLLRAGAVSKRGGIGEGYFSASILYGCNVCRHGACSPMRSCALWTRQDNVPKAVEAGMDKISLVML